ECGPGWTIFPSPNQGPYGNFLHAVAAVSANDIWAAGDYRNQDPPIYRSEMLRWDGSNWSFFSTPNPGLEDNDFLGLGVVSSSDIWAVGSYDGDPNGSWH